MASSIKDKYLVENYAIASANETRQEQTVAVANNTTGTVWTFNSQVRAAKVIASVEIKYNTSTFAYQVHEFLVIQGNGDWNMSESFIQAAIPNNATDLTFSITSGGLLQYTSPDYLGGLVEGHITFQVKTLNTQL